MGLSDGGHMVLPFFSWEPRRGKKRSREPMSEDNGFEIVPIEDPGEWVCTQ